MSGRRRRDMADSPAEGWQDYVPQVREYLAYCERSRAWLAARGWSLDPRCHPTADGAVKMTAHGGNVAEAEKVRQAFRELTSTAS